MPTPSAATTEIRARRGIERRALTEAEKASGYIGAVRSIIPYGSDSGELRDRRLNNGKPFVEQIAAGAFKRSLETPGDILAFVGHTDDPLAAFARAGANLTFTDTAAGLEWEALAPDTAACRDLVRLVESGVIKGASFEFSVRGADGERWEKRDGRDVRVITSAELYAVNPVAVPAYDESALTVSLRSRDHRGLYAYENNYEYTPVDDVSYAERALASLICEFSAAQRYLRNNPSGAHADYAAAAVGRSSGEIKTLLDWLAANGAKLDDTTAARAREIAAEKRSTTPANEPATFSDHDRERRFRILTLDSR